MKCADGTKSPCRTGASSAFTPEIARRAVGGHPLGMMHQSSASAILNEPAGTRSCPGRQRSALGSVNGTDERLLMATTSEASKGARTRRVLLTLAAGQFLMTLDSSVMNVAIATVAKDVGTTVTGIQTAITLYTLVMAMLMIPGGKVGSLIGRRRAFAIGCVIYGAGSLTTALAQNLAVLIVGWSVLEGIGAALILPAIVALVASNFGAGERPRAY